MTANQKRRITLMRQNHVGYAAIANELKLPLSTVKAFCRRNGLQASDLASDTQPENIAEASPDIGYIRLLFIAYGHLVRFVLSTEPCGHRFSRGGYRWGFRGIFLLHRRKENDTILPESAVRGGYCSQLMG